MGFIFEVALLADLAAVRQWLVDHGVVADLAAATVAIPNGTPIERARMHAVRLRLDQIPAAARDRVSLLDAVNALNAAHRRAFVIGAGIADPGADMAALNAAVVQAVNGLAPAPVAPVPAPVPPAVVLPGAAPPVPVVAAPPPPGGHVVVPVQAPRASLTTLTEKILLIALVLALLGLTVFATRTWLSGDDEKAGSEAAAAYKGAAPELAKAGSPVPTPPPATTPPTTPATGGVDTSAPSTYGGGTTVNVNGPPPVTVNVNVAGGSPCLAGMRSLGFAEQDAKAGCGL